MRRRKSVPVYIPSGQARPSSKYAPVRKQLRSMTFDEQVQHLRQLHQEVSEQKAFTQGYLNRRAGQGKQTGTDLQYTRYQRTADDLLALLEELINEAESPGGGQP